MDVFETKHMRLRIGELQPHHSGFRTPSILHLDALASSECAVEIYTEMLFIVAGPALRCLNIEGVGARSRSRNRTTPSNRERLRIDARSRTRRVPVKVDLRICACQRRLA